jgi:hypothetical protein
MPPKRRGTRAKTMTKLSQEDQKKRVQCDLFLKDFDQFRESVINESKREMETVIQSLTTTYKLELMKIPTDVKNSNWMEYYQSSINNGVDLLNVSNAINACIDDSICIKVHDQLSQLKSAMKSTKKSRTVKEKVPSTATRSSSRKRNQSADPIQSGTVARSSSRSRKRGLVDSVNLETPADTRSRRGKPQPVVPETPASQVGIPGMRSGMATPMITPKVDPNSMTRTVTRRAKGPEEVLFSLEGSPVVPLATNRSKAAKEFLKSHVQVPLFKGQTLNLPLEEDFVLPHDELVDKDLDQLKTFVARMQSGIAMMEAAKEHQSD